MTEKRSIVIPLYACLLISLHILASYHLPNLDKFLVTPYTLTHHLSIVTLLKGLSINFYHASWSHLIGNLTWILICGVAVEKRIGSWKTVMMIALGCVTSLLGHVFYDPNSLHLFLGASGVASCIFVVYTATI